MIMLILVTVLHMQKISAGKGMIMGCDTKVAGDYAIPVEANVDYLLSMWINVQELDGTPVNGIYPNITFDFAIDTKMEYWCMV